MTKPDYCTQPTVEACYLCSLTSYGMDCMNNPIRTGVKYADLPLLNILKSPDISVDDEGNMLWMNGKKPINYDQAIEQIRDQLVENIMGWDHERIEALWDMITDLEMVYTRLEDHIDLSALPSEPIPNGKETYPIWAMDKSGNCLVGQGQLSIENISDI